jgi:hypothetical protein
MTRLKFSAVSAGLLLAVVSATAQTPNPTTTCAAPPVGLNSLLVEYVSSLQDAQSTLTASLPPAYAGMIFSGMYEIHSRFSYDPATKLMTNSLFLVPPGSPLPTASNYNFIDNRFGFVVAAIDNMYFSCVPLPAAMLTGRVIDGYPIWEGPAGAPYAIGFGYSTDNPPVLRDWDGLAVGLGNLWNGHPTGTVVFANVAAVIAGAPTITTATRNIVLDGSGSQGPNLIYQWSQGSFGLTIVNPTSSVTPVNIDYIPGTYTAKLTVTDTAINESASTTVNIVYKPKN